MAIAFDDLWTLCEKDDDTQLSLSKCSDSDTDTTFDLFPELALDDTEYMTYLDADNVVCSYKPRGIPAVVDDTKSSMRRQTELKRLAANGWQRDDPTKNVLGKRNLYTYRGPNGVVETSMKRVMKQIRLSLIVDAANNKELDEVSELI